MRHAGTSACDLWEVDETPEILVYGQQGDLCSLATNSCYGHVYATVSDSEKVIVWSALSRKVRCRQCWVSLWVQDKVSTCVSIDTLTAAET